MKNEFDTVTPDMFDGTVQRLKDEWAETIKDKGGHCPICDQFGKIYKYKLNQSLALSLKWIIDHGGEDGWIDVQKKAPRWMMRSKTYPLLAHWDMIEDQSSRSGIWRATWRGRHFVYKNFPMPVAVYVYNNRIWAFDAEHTSFQGCFGVKFDFAELMSSNFNWANVTLEN